MLMEQPAEIERVIVTDSLGYLCNIVFCRFKQVLCVCHTQRQDILHRRYLEHLSEASYKPAGAHVA